MAKELARQGAKVALLGRTLSKLDAVKNEIKAEGGTAIAIACDVTSDDEVTKASKVVEKHLGKCNILINGAGVNQANANTTNETYRAEDVENPEVNSFFDLSPGAVRQVMDLNFTGTLIPSQIFAKQMLEVENPTIINISSMSAPCPMTKVPGYSAAKAAIDNFTQWLAVHMADAGIRVNAIAPGFFLTEDRKSTRLNSSHVKI